jgi:hypothetical protein
MKRLWMSVAVAITAAALGPVAPSTAKPGEDRVVGTGQGTFPTDFGAFPSHAHVNAKGDAQAAHGHAWARFDTPVGEVLIKGTPFCVDAVGNQAVVGFVVEQSNIGLVPVGSRILRKVIDNGEGLKDPPDQTGTTVAPQSTTTCPPGTTPIPTGAVDQGNFVVDDGTP